jgi:hypothetical protein
MRSTVVSLKKENNNIIECDRNHIRDASGAPLSYGSVQMISFGGTQDRRDAALAASVAAGLGEKFALTNERIAILEAQRREDKSLMQGHLDSCSERWAEAKEEMRSLRAHVDERFDRVERDRHTQHRANITLLVTIVITLFAGALTAIIEHWIR